MSATNQSLALEPVTTLPETATDIVSQIVRMAADPQMDVAKLEKLIELSERIQRRNAEGSFNHAFTELQKELPTIAAKKKGDKWMYAPIEDIVEIVLPICLKHGFTLSHTTEWPTPGTLKVVGILSHIDGHSRRSEFQSTADNSGSKNAIQGLGSANHYGRRYTTLDLLCIVTRDADDDGAKTSAPEPPDGFEDWWIDMTTLAQDGLAALEKGWHQSKKEFKRYVKHYPRRWEDLKRAAAKVQGVR